MVCHSADCSSDDEVCWWLGTATSGASDYPGVHCWEDARGMVEMKVTENGCDFCMENNDLVDHSSPLTEFVTGPWEEAFNHLKEKVDDPEDLVHGLPFRYSMLIWRKGSQDKSAIIYNIQNSDQAGMMILEPGFLGPLCCPVCGRPLNEEEE